MRTTAVTALAVAANLLVAMAGSVPAWAAQHTVYLPYTRGPAITAAVEASRPRGFQDEPFVLELATRTQGARIRYTTDGSTPGPSTGLDYVAPLAIASTTVVRAVARREGFADSAVSTFSYLFLDDLADQSNGSAEARGYPPTWGRHADDWVLSGQPVAARYDVNQSVLGLQGQTLHADLRSLPSLSLVTSIADMFGPAGIYSNPMLAGVEKPASVELLDDPGQPGFQIDCGVRIAGGYSRRPDVTNKHSFSLRFRSRYGASRLRYPVFAGSDVASFDVLRLRASQADAFDFFADKAQYLHDEWGRATQRDMGWLSARGRFVHLFINGLYWGIYDLAEEPTATFVSDHLGGAEEGWDVIKDGDAVDGVWVPEVEDGDMAAYAEMLEIVAADPEPDPADPADREAYVRLSELLDLEQHADYTLLQIYGANYDWPEKNYRAARNRALAGRFWFFVWDFEHTTALRDAPERGLCLPRTDPATGECGYNADTAGVGGLHGWLLHFPDYRMVLADRIDRHLIDPQGALAPAAAGARYAALAAALDRAIVGEAARWGTPWPAAMTAQVQRAVWRDYQARRGGAPQTPDMWRAERDRLLAGYFPRRSGQVLAQLCRLGLQPMAHAPEIDLVGEEGTSAARVHMTAGTAGCPGGTGHGTIYYTRNGDDPREPGGGVTRTAREYTGPLRVGRYVSLRARTLAPTSSGLQWSAETRATFGMPRIVPTEVMYHPPDEPDAEFIELRNGEPVEADFSGYRITGAVTATFPAGTLVPAGGHVLAVRDPDVFDARYPGVAPAAVYDGKLDNAGETFLLSDSGGSPIVEVTYDDEGLWPLAADGLGFSLVPLDPTADLGAAEAWRASAQVGGSPGRDDPEPAHGPGWVVPNEVLANPGPAQDTAAELANPSSWDVDAGGWLLSDDRDDLGKFVIGPATVIPAGGTAAFYGPELEAAGVLLDPTGGRLFLASTDRSGRLSGVLSELRYEAAEPGRSTGRVATSAGDRLALLERPTFGVDQPVDAGHFRTGGGAPNAPAHVGPVVISEIMYHPADGAGEYLEIANRSEVPVALHAPGEPARPWRLVGGVSYQFPTGLALGPGQRVVVAGVDPREFRIGAGMPVSATVLGPFIGRLDNAGEALRLVEPWTTAPGGQSGLHLTVDTVAYGPRSPWPVAADGGGPSLERRELGLYGAEPTHWTALLPGGTPGEPGPLVRRLWLPLVAIE